MPSCLCGVLNRERLTQPVSENPVHIIDTHGAYDLAATFSLLSMGSGDPCLQFDGRHRLKMALWTPAGPVAIDVRQQDANLYVSTSGPGSDWISPHLASLFGVNYDPPEIGEPAHLKRIARNYAGMRLATLPAISSRLIQIVLQQLISFRDACAGWRKLVRKYGTPAPAQADLWLPPSPDVLSRLASYQFIECGILPQHGRRIVSAMRYASRLESTWNAGQAPDASEATCQLLRHIPGIGPWTIGFLRGAGLGDADAVVPGDYGHPKHVANFFTGREDADDAEMVRLLEPYRPHRFYVLTLLIKGASAPPRRGPRRRRLSERLR